MHALTLHAPYDLRCEAVADPRIEEPTDVIVRVELAGLCGSDLHAYRGHETGWDAGTVMGHEFVGRIVETGRQVIEHRVDEHVVAPFSTSCGECFYCARGLTARCERGELFGWLEKGEGLYGAQAEFIRVPLADSTLVQIPEGADPEAVLLAGDVLSTGLFVAELGGVGPESVVVVLGCGPVGLMAVVACRELGAHSIFAIDSVPERLALAEKFGAIPLNLEDSPHYSPLLDATDGRGVDAVLECVGTPSATRLAVDLVRPGGTLAVAGVHTEETFAFAPGEAYDKNLTYRTGRCSARHFMDRTVPLAASGKYDIGAIISHRLPLSDGPAAYEMFDRRTEACTKVVFAP